MLAVKVEHAAVAHVQLPELLKVVRVRGVVPEMEFKTIKKNCRADSELIHTPILDSTLETYKCKLEFKMKRERKRER